MKNYIPLFVLCLLSMAMDHGNLGELPSLRQEIDARIAALPAAEAQALAVAASKLEVVYEKAWEFGSATHGFGVPCITPDEEQEALADAPVIAVLGLLTFDPGSLAIQTFITNDIAAELGQVRIATAITIAGTPVPQALPVLPAGYCFTKPGYVKRLYKNALLTTYPQFAQLMPMERAAILEALLYGSRLLD